MTMKVLKTAKTCMMTIRNVPGKVLSTTATSLEKRLTMRPDGVVSKKDIGDRMIFDNMLAWRLPAAVTILELANSEKAKTTMAETRKWTVCEIKMTMAKTEL